MAKKEIAVKKYAVELSGEERKRLEALIHAGKSSARMLTRARILLKADISEAGEGWSDREISAALDTSVNNVARTRQQLVEEGFEATLKRRRYSESLAERRAKALLHIVLIPAAAMIQAFGSFASRPPA